MREFFRKLDAGLFKGVSFFLGLAMICLTAIVFVQVIARYVFHASLGGLEELPVYLMMISVWLAAPFVAKNDDHLKIELLDTIIKSKFVLKIIAAIVKVITTVVMCYFAVIAFQYVASTFQMGDISPGLGIPMWILQGVVFLSAALMTLYYAILSVRDFKEVATWKS